MLAERGAKVTVVANPALRELLSTLPGVHAVTGGEPIPDARFDYWIPVCSVPLILGADQIPENVPYLRADPAKVEKWRRRLPGGVRIGLGWKGSASNLNDAERSLELAQLRPLWSAGAQATFVSLQKDRDEAIPVPPDQPMIQLGADIKDFSDIAAIVAQIELVISVETSLAHVVGALGRPGWVLLPRFQVDWRWLRTGDHSPWYPSLRLFRQGNDFAWSRPIQAAAAALAAL